MQLQWIKLALNTFDDEKIKLIDSMPERDTVLIIWFKLLTLAGKCNDGGVLTFSDIPYDEEMLSAIFNRPINSIRLALGIFKKYQMITFLKIDSADNNIAYFITNWDKHQNIEGIDKIREQNKIRKQNQREKERILLENKGMSRDGHVTITHGHATEEEEDKEIDLDKDKRLSTEEEEFRSGEKRPAKSGIEKGNVILLNKKTNLLELSDTTLNLLQDAYPDIDIPQKLKEMSVWLIAHTETVIEIEQFDNNFIRFAAKWLSNENDKKKNKKKTTNTRTYAISFNPETANLIGADNDYINILKSKFLGINVETEIKKMESWLFNNPSKRPTKDYPRFINRWLAQEQDKVSTRHSSQGQFISRTNQTPQTFAEKKLQNSLSAVAQVKQKYSKGINNE